MQPLLFQKSGDLSAGEYLPGQYQWPYAVVLQSAMLIARGGSTNLTLELGGVLTAVSFGMSGPVTEVEGRQTLTLNLTVPTNTSVRWQVTGGDPTTSISAAAITVSAAPASAVSVTVPRPALTVWYVNGSAQTLAFTYDAESHSFTDAGPGASLGLAITDNGVQWALTYQGVKLLQASAGSFYGQWFTFLGNTLLPGAPRLEFRVDRTRVGNLGLSASRPAFFAGTDITELVGGPPVLTPDAPAFYGQFAFFSNGGLAATLDVTGLTAAGLIEEAVLA